MAEKDSRVIFGGRLGQYAYFDMDDTIASAILLTKRSYQSKKNKIMTRYYLSKNYNGLNNAGNKAKTDIEETLSKLGYKMPDYRKPLIPTR